MESKEFPPVTDEHTSEKRTRQLPQEFESYQVIEELARGGQATVYKALHKPTKTKVALKVLMPGLLISAKARRRFELEVELVSGLNHPFIVGVRDSGIASGQYFFTMEYIRGLPFDEYTRTKALPLRQTMELLAKVCNAMAHAHQRGVIHRDLKSSNILVDERGDPHVLDFGLAKAAQGVGQGVSMLSITGEIKGTLPYMSPEQASGSSELLDVRTDVYSIGVVMYKALTNRFPYEVTGSAASVLRNIESVEPARLRQVTPRFDKDVEVIVLKCLEKDPSTRYHSAADLEEDIQNWLHNRPLTAKCQNITYVLVKKLARYRRTVAIVGLLTMILFSLGVRELQISRKRRRSQEREGLANRQLDSMINTVGLNMPWTIFLNFLEKWHGGAEMRLNWSTEQLDSAGGIKEYAAMQFLINIDKSGLDESGFSNRFQSYEQWFADFVIGEAYLYLHDKKKALAAYRRSHEAFHSVSQDDVSGDGIFKRLVIMRLSELGVNDKEINDNPSGAEQLENSYDE